MTGGGCRRRWPTGVRIRWAATSHPGQPVRARSTYPRPERRLGFHHLQQCLGRYQENRGRGVSGDIGCANVPVAAAPVRRGDLAEEVTRPEPADHGSIGLNRDLALQQDIEVTVRCPPGYNRRPRCELQAKRRVCQLPSALRAEQRQEGHRVWDQCGVRLVQYHRRYRGSGQELQGPPDVALLCQVVQNTQRRANLPCNRVEETMARPVASSAATSQEFTR